MHSSTSPKVLVFYLEGGLENPLKKTETRGKSFFKTSFQLRMELKKEQKPARDERTQEDYLTSAAYMLGSLLVFFNLCLVSVLFSAPSLTEMGLALFTRSEERK